MKAKVICFDCYRLTRAGNVRADGRKVECSRCVTKALYDKRRKDERATKKGYLP